MWKALIYKELRETAGIAALAVGAYFLFISAEMRVSLIPLIGNSSVGIPFLGGGLSTYFIMVSLLFMVMLGFRQTAWELKQGTFLFLMHRPISRNQLLLTKLTSGFVVYLICSAIPLLCLALWAAMPTTHASPFFWSMTLPYWKLWIGLSVIYQGAFASGMLDGRWLGRRLLPLVASILAAVLITSIPWWWLTSFPLLIISHAVGVTTIFHIAKERDYS